MTNNEMELEGLFVEFGATPPEAHEHITTAMEALGLAIQQEQGQGQWVLGKPLLDPEVPGRVGVEVLAPAGLAIGPREGWMLGHALQAELGAEAVEPMFRGDAQLEADHGDEGLQTSAEAPPDVRWHFDPIRLHEAHKWLRERDCSLGGPILIGHPDTGYTEHPEIWEHLDPSKGKNFVEKGDPLDPRDDGVALQPGHGTSTASMIISAAEVTVPREGGGAPADLLGVAPEATVVPIRVTKSVVVLGWQRRLARAIEFAVGAKCRVISISLGGVGGRRLRRAVRYAESRGVIIVAAGGNVVQFVVAPATYPTVVACAATGPDNKPWLGSSKGRAITITAPGHLTWVAGWDGKRAIARPSSGTSYATATVAGAAALWLVAKQESLKTLPAKQHAEAFRHALRASAQTLGSLPGRWYGAGMLDVAALLEQELSREESLTSSAADDEDALLLEELRSITEGSDEESVSSEFLDELDTLEQRELLFHMTVDPAARRAWKEGRALDLPTLSPRLRSGLRRAVERVSRPTPPARTQASSPTPSATTTVVAGGQEIVIRLDVVIEVTVKVGDDR